MTRRTLVTVLEALLRASHPFMPFITEEIWQRVAPLAGACGESIMLQRWPDPAFFPVDDEAEAELGWIQGFILAVRQIRGEMDIAPGKRIPVLLQDATADDIRLLAVHDRYLRELARLSRASRCSRPAAQPPPSATALVGSLKLLVPIAGLIDVAAERARLTKNRAEGGGRPGAGRAEAGHRELHQPRAGSRGGQGAGAPGSAAPGPGEAGRAADAAGLALRGTGWQLICAEMRHARFTRASHRSSGSGSPSGMNISARPLLQ